MSTESIKKLVQFENEAKDMLNQANKKYEDMKYEAKNDAMEVVKAESEKLENNIKILEQQANKHIESIKIKVEQEFKYKKESIGDIKNKDRLVKELLDKICMK